METLTEAKTCRITLVTPGLSDRVIRVYPAEHESETIWLNNTPGIERWEAVKRMLYTDAERGTRVPDPAPYHEGHDLKTVVLKEDDIPTVRLSTQVLKKPAEQERAPVPVSPNAENINARFERLEKAIASLAESFKTAERMPQAEVRRGPGRPRKEA